MSQMDREKNNSLGKHMFEENNLVDHELEKNQGSRLYEDLSVNDDSHFHNYFGFGLNYLDFHSNESRSTLKSQITQNLTHEIPKASQQVQVSPMNNIPAIVEKQAEKDDKKQTKKQARNDNNAAKLYHTIVREMVSKMGFASLLNDYKKTSKRNYIHLLMCEIEACGRIDQFMSQFQVKMASKIKDIEEQFQMNLMNQVKRDLLVQTFQKTMQGCKQFAVGDHKSSMVRIYKAGNASVIKHWSKYKEGQEEVKQLRKKLNLSVFSQN